MTVKIETPLSTNPAEKTVSAPSLKQRAVSGAIWYGSTRLVIQAITWVITILVARLLSPADYGLMGFALIVVGFGDLVSELGLGPAIIQKLHTDAVDLDTAFWSAVVINVILAAVIIAGAPLVAGFFDQPKLASVLRVLSAYFVITALRIVPWSLLTKEIDFKRRSLAEVSANIAGSAATLALASAGKGVWALVAGMLGQQIVITIITYRLHPWSPGTQFSLRRLRELAPFGASVSLSKFLFFIYSNADSFIVGKFLGQTVLGIYGMAYRLTTMLADKFIKIINDVGFPVYSKLQAEPARAKQYFLRSMEVVALIIFPILVGMNLVADDAIPLLLGAKWLELIAPFKMLCWTGLVLCVGALLAPLLFAKGRADINVRFSATCTIVMPVAFWFGTKFGLLGICLVWAFIYPVLVIGFYASARKVIGYEWHEIFAALAPATLSVVVMIAAVASLNALMSSWQQPVGRVAFAAIGGGLSYLVALRGLFPSSIQAVRDLLQARHRQPAS